MRASGLAAVGRDEHLSTPTTTDAEPELGGRLAECLIAFGDTECLRHEDEAWWSGRQVLSLSRQVLGTLDRLGVPRGARVALVLGNTVEDVSGLLAVLIGERVVSAVNPRTPTDRMRGVLEALSPAVVVVAGRNPAAAAAAAAVNVPVVVVAADSVETQGGRAKLEAAQLSGVAVELPTSGSTGPPKRVQITHRQLESSFRAAGVARREPGVHVPGAVVTVPLCHIGGLWALLSAIAAGQRVVLLDKFTVSSFLRAVEFAQPRAVGVPPAGVRMLVEAELPSGALGPVKVVTSGSARLDPALADAFYQRFNVPALSVYGATELAGAVAGWTLKDHRAWWAQKRGSVGRAFPGCQLRIVDEAGEPLAAGSVGLLEVWSDQSVQGPGVWVRTHDLARLDADGFLFIEGRADDAIVRGGFKVAPTTVRAALESHPDVIEAIVVPQPDERLGHVPVAVIESRAAAPPSEEDLLAWCRERLLPYELPARVVVVDSLPRSAAMKVTRSDVLALLGT